MKYVLFAAMALVLSVPALAYAEGNYAGHSNGDRGHHRCGGNNGQGGGNNCIEKKQEPPKQKGGQCQRNDSGGKSGKHDGRLGLDNGKGNGGYNSGHGNEGRGAYGRNKNADKQKFDAEKLKNKAAAAVRRAKDLELKARYSLPKKVEYYKYAARNFGDIK